MGMINEVLEKYKMGEGTNKIIEVPSPKSLKSGFKKVLKVEDPGVKDSRSLLQWFSNRLEYDTDYVKKGDILVVNSQEENEVEEVEEGDIIAWFDTKDSSLYLNPDNFETGVIDKFGNIK